jgi:pyruvate oxidase
MIVFLEEDVKMSKINAADAMIKVLEDWHVDHLFGLPGGSFDSTMNALHNRKSTMKYIQVRHEETGAIAAAGEAKLTGKIGGNIWIRRPWCGSSSEWPLRC